MVSEVKQQARNWVPVWSASRSRWIQSCPRRYLLQYVAGRSGVQALDRPRRWLWKQGRWAPINELLKRAVKDTLRAWMFDAHAGICWSINTAHCEMERRFQSSISSQQDEMVKLQSRLQRPTALYRTPTPDSIARLIEDGDLILRRALNHPLIGELLSCRYSGEWQPLDPFEISRTKEGLAYLTPDLIIKGPQRWVLIRLLSDSWKHLPDATREVELLGMVKWALEEPTLPNSEESYEIARISHSKKRGWRTWRRQVKKNETEILRQMIRSDISAARDLVRSAGPMLNLDRIPLAEKKWRCKDCGFRFTCPGGTDIESAKIQQAAAEQAYVNSKS
ncbi:MAG: hypothetical protein HOA04_01530 [Euryarchaeota archaeon]|jgi:hypothetical protein|nr:hypothetical protein [Euryarchaeota archaeon]MBT7937607.1 hypothetical protein [Euryarchaeota archaeon]